MSRAFARQIITKTIYRATRGWPRLSEKFARKFFNKRRKRYIDPRISVPEFFKLLRDRDVDYVVLRRFEELPDIPKGRSLDILIADHDLERIADLWSLWPLGQQIDLYSETGRSGFAFSPSFVELRQPHEMAPFPPHLARQILERACLRDGLYRVPCEADHFLSIAYHAVYLEGLRSGLASTLMESELAERVSHDYATVLGELAIRVGISVPSAATLEDLDEILGACGWRPTEDMLERISVWSPWVQRRYFSSPDAFQRLPGVTVFFVRERASLEGWMDGIVELIENRGFEPLLVRELTPEHKRSVTQEIRGGNWGQGVFALSGGPPVSIIVALDVLPMPVPREIAKEHPLLENLRTLKVKNMIRIMINADRPRKQQYNAVHSTDSFRQAWSAIQLCAPEDIGWLAETVRARLDEFGLPADQSRNMTRHGHRARVEIIQRDGGLAVKKTFKPQCRRFLEREVEVLQLLADSGNVPKILAVKDNAVLLEHIEDVWRGNVPRPLPLSCVRQLAGMIKTVAAAGYDPVDFAPRNNLLMDRNGGMKAIDFEFWHDRGESYPPDDAHGLVGVPDTSRGDLPAGVDYFRNPYPSQWFPYTGLDLATFLNGSPIRQIMMRTINYPYIKVRYVLAPFLWKAAIKGNEPYTLTKLGRGLRAVWRIGKKFHAEILHRA
ncbi:hypothetical protein M1105_12955 [Limibaculum sp. FT325]|uniref:hypothetical protein n=1 Tax=Thermohalobaculum sediminis TaxID=2939436 RepID=UPI0020BF4739|nr:hypothetical protein [Limibaculum sediminis]MCL5777891.1 hypothetical protein [Limibaculum sediminis]